MTREECEAILNQIEEAYSVLGFPEKRKEYDRVRGFNKNDPSSSEKVKQELFLMFSMKTIALT